MLHPPMLRPGPTTAAALAALALGAFAAAVSRAAVDLLGSAPLHLLGAGAALAAALAVGQVVSLRRKPVTAPWRLLWLMPAGAIWFGDHGLAALADLLPEAGVKAGVLRGGLLLGTVVACAPLAGPLLVALRPAGRWTPLVGGLGFVLAAGTPPAGTALAVALLVAVADRVPSPERGWAPAAPADAPRSVDIAALVAVLGVVATFLAVRTTFDPSLRGAQHFAVGTLVGLGLGGRRPVRSAAAGLLVASISLSLAHIIAAATPTMADELAAAVLAATADGSRTGAHLLLLIGAVIGVPLGTVWNSGRTRPWPGLASGLVIGAALGPSAALPWLTAATGLTAPLWTTSLRARAGGLALGALAVGLALQLPAPTQAQLARGVLPHLRDSDDLLRDAAVREKRGVTWAEAGASLAGALRVTEPDTSAANVLPTPLTIELDGLMSEARSRAGAAEAMGGLLGQLLAERLDRVAILGDAAGRATAAFAPGSQGAVHVATPSAPLVRAMSERAPELREAWLRPGLFLRPLHGRLMVRTLVELDAIVEVTTAPWGDGSQGGVDAAWLRDVSKRLGPGGVYVLVVHLGAWPEGGPAALAGACAATFGSCQVWLPPGGADTMTLVGSASPPPLARLVGRGLARTPSLAELGIDSPIGLAGLAVTGSKGAAAWATERGDLLPSTDQLSAALFERPTLHLTGLAPHVEPPMTVWDTRDATDLVERVAAPQEASRLLLELLARSAKGDIGGTFEAARALGDVDQSGLRPLDPLIEPHLRKAQKSLARARSEGLRSSGWDEAVGFATTARMLAPKSARPVVALADIQLSRGSTDQARKLYEDALALDGTDIDALSGIARVARMRGDGVTAESSLRRATEVAPRNWETWQRYGTMLSEIGRSDEAEDALRRASGMAPTDEVAPNLALANLYLQMQQPARALVQAERAIAVGRAPYGFYLRGRCRYDMGQYEVAEQDFRKAVLQDPNMVEARFAIGLVRAVSGDPTGAAAAFRDVLASDPSNEAARENLRLVEVQIEQQRRTEQGLPATLPPQ
jgi:tetratricopeptide (TPR) repeat protein